MTDVALSDALIAVNQLPGAEPGHPDQSPGKASSPREGVSGWRIPVSPEAHSFRKPSRKGHSKASSSNARRVNMRMTPFVPDGPKKEPNGRGSPGRLRWGATCDDRAAGPGEGHSPRPEIRKARSMIFLEV